MAAFVVTHLDQVTPAWLTGVLLRSGGLVSGAVADISISAEHSVNAHIARVAVIYDVSATGERPRSLLLKLCQGDVAATSSEVAYYARDYISAPDAPMPRCYDAAYDATEWRYHVLLADLTTTHDNAWPYVPSKGYAFALADAFSALHAPHWGVAPMHVPAKLDAFVAHARQGLQPLIDHLGPALPAKWRKTMLHLFGTHPEQMKARLRDSNGFTLIHGDANPGNVLRPREGRGRVLLIDRQPFEWSFTSWTGASDVSYAIAHWWPTPLRRALELPMLKRYHRGLLRRGVRGYSLNALIADYKLSLPISLYEAVQWCGTPEDVQRMQWVWWPQLQKSMCALMDHAI
jgi:hypothetical protein